MHLCLYLILKLFQLSIFNLLTQRKYESSIFNFFFFSRNILSFAALVFVISWNSRSIKLPFFFQLNVPKLRVWSPTNKSFKEKIIFRNNHTQLQKAGARFIKRRGVVMKGMLWHSCCYANMSFFTKTYPLSPWNKQNLYNYRQTNFMST